MDAKQIFNQLQFGLKIGLVLFALVLAGCVQVDPETGKTIPRQGQKYKFSDVQKNAENLKQGMTKFDVLMLLGSPAKEVENGNVWVYLPERTGTVVPSKSLRLEFNNNLLVKHGYSAIVLGQEL